MLCPAVVRRIESNDRRSCAVLRMNGWRRTSNLRLEADSLRQRRSRELPLFACVRTSCGAQSASMTELRAMVYLAQSGQQTVVVERRWVGGSCPNVNCLPSKNEIWSAKVADLVHHAARFGVFLGSASSDMALRTV